MSTMTPEALDALAVRALRANGAPADIAATVASVLVEADVRGVASHGVARLPNYIARARAGLVDAAATAEIVTDAGGLVVLDGRNGYGPTAAARAVEIAAERAAAHGVAWVSVRRSNHFGLAAAYSRWLARAGCAAIVLSNAPPAMAAFGGKRPVLGTNPISMAVPGAEPPVTLDMATTVVARGKIRRAAAEGAPIAESLALDADGHPTTDAGAALDGTLAPIGGPKGYGLALMIELMTGFLAGGAASTELGESSDFSGEAGTCFTFIAARTDHVRQPEARLAEIVAMVRGSGEPGEVLMPGEIEDRRAEASMRDGLAIPAKVLAEIEALL
ncbi:Ldh family oxidoreductase [Acuticoccus sediminis]|nr:Ldh family oxidoreductase [Acuticoccus sediminis]